MGPQKLLCLPIKSLAAEEWTPGLEPCSCTHGNSPLRKEKEDGAVKGSGSQLCTHAEVPKLSPKNYVSPTHTFAQTETLQSSVLINDQLMSFKEKGQRNAGFKLEQMERKEKVKAE